MAYNVIAYHNNVRELAELRWRNIKLAEMKNCITQKGQRLDTEKAYFNQCQSSQFFLGLKSSRLIETKDEFSIEKESH